MSTHTVKLTGELIENEPRFCGHESGLVLLLQGSKKTYLNGTKLLVCPVRIPKLLWEVYSSLLYWEFPSPQDTWSTKNVKSLRPID